MGFVYAAGMAIVTLLLRDLKTGQRATADFETLDDCLDWLAARPQFLDVLGPVNEDLSPEGDRMLRAALRPYDEEEKALMSGAEAQAEALVKAVAEQLAVAQKAERDRIASLGPDEPMVVVWTRGQPVVHAEPLDQRPIPSAVLEAVSAWVEERNDWVRGRGQSVCAAQVTVYPGTVPPGMERIQPGGQFELS